MDSSFYNKIQKSKEYALEPERATFHTLEVEFRGDNNTYKIALSNAGWSCTCPGFQAHHICPHIMTLEKLFKPFLKREPLRYAEGQNIVSDVKKSKQYSEEPDRITILAFTAAFRGDNREHLITYNNGIWDNPTSNYWASHGISTHVMTMERLLEGFVKPARLPSAEQVVE
jgi:hypothetical protein